MTLLSSVTFFSNLRFTFRERGECRHISLISPKINGVVAISNANRAHLVGPRADVGR